MLCHDITLPKSSYPGNKIQRCNRLCQRLLTLNPEQRWKNPLSLHAICRAGQAEGDGREQGSQVCFYLHLHCSAVIAHGITAADVMGKNGFSQDSFDPLICPWGMAQMLGPGLHFHHLIHVFFLFFYEFVWRHKRKSVCVLVSWFGGCGQVCDAATDTESLLKTM